MTKKVPTYIPQQPPEITATNYIVDFHEKFKKLEKDEKDTFYGGATLKQIAGLVKNQIATIKENFKTNPSELENNPLLKQQIEFIQKIGINAKTTTSKNLISQVYFYIRATGKNESSKLALQSKASPTKGKLQEFKDQFKKDLKLRTKKKADYKTMSCSVFLEKSGFINLCVISNSTEVFSKSISANTDKLERLVRRQEEFYQLAGEVLNFLVNKGIPEENFTLYDRRGPHNRPTNHDADLLNDIMEQAKTGVLCTKTTIWVK